MILDYDVGFEDPIILRRPINYTVCAFVCMEKGKMKFSLKKDEATFYICRSMMKGGELYLL